MNTSVQRYHDICMGHRVVGHEGKCKHLHGHNYRFHFDVRLKPEKELDQVGRVVDFSVIAAKLCDWLEKNWDHKMMLWEEDSLVAIALGDTSMTRHGNVPEEGFVIVPFNPTAENIASHFLYIVAPEQFKDTDVYLHCVRIDETRKCSATVSLS